MCEAGDGDTSVRRADDSRKDSVRSRLTRNDLLEELDRKRAGHYGPTGLLSGHALDAASDPATDPGLAFGGHENW